MSGFESELVADISRLKEHLADKEEYLANLLPEAATESGGRNMIASAHAKAMRRHVEAALEYLQWTLQDIADNEPSRLAGRLRLAGDEVENALELANDLEPPR